ncbi:hypothetical protein PCK1_001027 [Pneumocystis canis]|nr:hypothetical protein PCK1_001027 [Pneumocystis canis]
MITADGPRYHNGHLGVLEIGSATSTVLVCRECKCGEKFLSLKMSDAYAFILSDTIETETAALQYDTEQTCLRYLKDHMIEQQLHQKSHLEYLLNVLTKPLPKSYLTLDASRPWIIYWTLCAYALLGQSNNTFNCPSST